MTSLIEIGLLNAALATILALLVWVVGKIIRRPALTHALWVLVLLKLVTPPLFEMETGLNLELASVFPSFDNQPQQVLEMPSEENLLSLDSTSFNTESISQTPEQSHTIIKNNSGSESNNTVSDFAPPNVIALNPASNEDVSNSNTDSILTIQPEKAVSAVPSFFVNISRAHLIPALIFLWLIGTIIWFGVQGMRLLGFFRALRHAKLAPDELQQQTRHLASAMGLSRCPAVRVVSGRLSPLMWSLGGKAELLFPVELLNRLDKESRATLIVHELAHYHRGDHWVRLLELCVGGIFWWHPVVWWAKARIEETEEACCDAWVVSQFSDDPRRYAEALLATVDFLSETPKRIPGVASGIGDARSIRTRLTSIMLGPAPKNLSSFGRISVLGLALILLPLKPGLFETPPDKVQAALTAPKPETVLSHEPIITQPVQNRESAPEPDSEPQAGVVLPNVVRELTTKESVSRIHQGEVWAQTYSRNGERIITATTDRGISFRNLQNNSVVDLTSYDITSVAFSPDGETFLSGSIDGTVRLWDASRGLLLKSFTGHNGIVRSVIFSPDGELIVSGGEDGTVRAWNLGQRQPPETLSQWTKRFSGTNSVNCIRFSPDGTQLAVATGNWKTSDSGIVHLWDLTTLERLHDFPCESAAGAVSYQPDGSTLIVGSWQGSITLWDLSTGKPFSTGKISKDTISLAAFSSDLNLLSSGSLPTEVRPPSPIQSSGEIAVNDRLETNAPESSNEKSVSPIK